MRVTATTTDPISLQTDAIIVSHFEGEAFHPLLADLDQKADRIFSSFAGLGDENEVSGKAGELTLFHVSTPYKRLLIAGLGKRESIRRDNYFQAAGAAARCLRSKNCKHIVCLLHHNTGGLPPAEVVTACVEGIYTGLWEPDRYHTVKKPLPFFEEVEFPAGQEIPSAELKPLLEWAVAVSESVNIARDLVNEPANNLSPSDLAKRAHEVAEAVGLQCEILDEDDMLRLGMGSLLAVSVGSENRARLIILKHKPNTDHFKLALVGKGVTFDSGGISIKPSDGMADMKGDMAGGAAVMGAMRAIALTKCPINVVGVIPAVENMPSGKAFRPGDVVKCMNGKTVEIITTDAEGRMILADALTYAVRNLKAENLIDAATLTGSCIVGLGNLVTGAMTNNRNWLAELKSVADQTGEPIWELPMMAEYSELIKSDIADIKNAAGRAGGAITAAKFLEEFVEGRPWVHLDIAGTADTDTAKPYRSKGATGVMVRTFTALAHQMAK